MKRTIKHNTCEETKNTWKQTIHEKKQTLTTPGAGVDIRTGPNTSDPIQIPTNRVHGEMVGGRL